MQLTSSLELVILLIILYEGIGILALCKDLLRKGGLLGSLAFYCKQTIVKSISFSYTPFFLKVKTYSSSTIDLLSAMSVGSPICNLKL
jgi:hypothetical protein